MIDWQVENKGEYKMDGASIDVLMLKWFQSLPAPLQEAVLQAMLALHAVCGRAIEMQEILLWASNVPQALAARYQGKIDAAEAWLRQLPFSGEGNGPGGQAELIDFVQQTVAFYGADKNITGRFLMGSPQDERGWFDDEGPQHVVTITQGFWLSDTACTQAVWQAVMGENPSSFNAKNKGGPAHRVEMVSWHMIQSFLQKLEGLLPGCRATLPTEAEWEYACRAGTTTSFSFGQTISTKQTVAVKALPANGWGLYQMHGNVWEWCADESRTYEKAAVTAPRVSINVSHQKSACAINWATTLPTRYEIRNSPVASTNPAPTPSNFRQAVAPPNCQPRSQPNCIAMAMFASAVAPIKA